jgi:hypothetical protein
MGEIGRKIWFEKTRAGDSKFYLDTAHLSTAMSGAENMGVMEKGP